MKSLLAVVLGISSLKLTLNEAAFTVIKWNKHLREFAAISEGSVERFEREEKALQKHLITTRNMNGQPLRIMYYEEAGFVHFYDNDTKMSGITGDLWTTLAHLFNFTLVLTNVKGGSLGITFPNGTYGGILEHARLNKTDVIPKMEAYHTRFQAVHFTPATWFTSQRIFAYGQWKRNRLWMIHLFSTQIWCMIFTFIVTLSFASKVTQRILIHHTGRQLQSESYINHLFRTYSTVCNQGNSPDNTGSGSRILSFTIGMFSWLILIGYSSHLIYSMSQEVYNPPFDDLASLFRKTNLKVLVLKGSIADITFSSTYAMPIFGRVRKSKRLKVMSDIEDLYDKVCSDSNKYVMFDTEDAVAGRGAKTCSVLPVGVAYYMSQVAAGVSRGFRNKKIIDIGIMKLREYGVIDAIKKRYLVPRSQATAINDPSSLAIDMDRVFVIFAVLCFGVLSSVVICAAENIVFALLTRRKTIETMIQRFPDVKRIVADRIKRPRG